MEAFVIFLWWTLVVGPATNGEVVARPRCVERLHRILEPIFEKRQEADTTLGEQDLQIGEAVEDAAVD